MTREEKELALYCLKASSDYHSEVCEECINYPNCDHMGQDNVTETIIKALEQEPVLDKIRAEIERQDFSHHDGSNHWYMTPPEVVNIVVGIIDKYKAEFEPQESEVEK